MKTNAEIQHFSILMACNERIEFSLRYGNYRMYHAYIRAKMYYLTEHRRITGES